MSPVQPFDRSTASDSDMAEELARLRSQVARYRMAFALSAPGQALVDLEGHFIEVNDSLCHLLGYTAKDLVGRRFQDITHPDDISDDARTMADMLAGRFGNHLREKRYLRPDGSTVWAQIKSRLVRNDQGQPLYFVTNIEDISDKKASEQAIREREALLSSMGKFVPGLIHKIGFDANGRARFQYISDRAIDSHIKNLRRKMDKVLPGDELIRSIYGVGYKFEWP